jgi:hypothetical protein
MHALERLPSTEAENQPDYFGLYDIAGLERCVERGIDTPRGRRSFEFRAGIEVEFSLTLPSEFTEYVINNERYPETFKQSNIRMVLNQETLESEDVDNDALLNEFKDYVRVYLQRIPATTDEEGAIRKQWLEQVDNFGLGEVVNFLIYEEFSRPQLSIPQIDDDSTVDGLDGFSDKNGWIEWRFGSGNLQSGYYDNPGMSEFRMTPCEPSEALRRLAVIKKRMAEIGTELGVLVMTDAGCEHINLSMYETNDHFDAGSRTVIGNDASRIPDTIDITSGIAEALQDGIGIDIETVKRYDFMFGKYSRRSLQIGPTRKTLRVLDGRIELRGGFASTEQGVAWVMAGAIDGLKSGVEALRNEGYQTTKMQEVLKVSRTAAFDKQRDLQIQRALEQATVSEDGRLVPDNGWSMTRSSLFAESITDEVEGGVVTEGLLGELIVASCVLKEGLISIDEETVGQAIEENLQKWTGDDSRQKARVKIEAYNIPRMISAINERLKVVTVEKTFAVVGDIEQKPEQERDEAIEHIRNSRVMKLALGAYIDEHVDLIRKYSESFISSNIQR